MRPVFFYNLGKLVKLAKFSDFSQRFPPSSPSHHFLRKSPNSHDFQSGARTKDRMRTRNKKSYLPDSRGFEILSALFLKTVSR